MLKLLLIIIQSLCTLPIYLLSFCVPKQKDLWVFGAWYGKKYADNTKYFFEYCETQKTTNYWIVKDAALLKSLSSKGINALYYLSLKGIWVQLRAEKAFISQSIMVDLFSPAINKTLIIQLWHGLALKKIMHDVDKSHKMKVFESVMSKIFPFSMHRQDYAIATSTETRKIFASAFNLPQNKVLITGLPRNDAFFNTNPISDKNKAKLNFIYMPTFRGGLGTEIDLFYKFNFDVERISKILDENNATLTLRLHPVNVPPAELLNAIGKKSNIFFSNLDDIYEEINNYDCLITDFSSIYLDYLLTGKSIVFAPFEFEEYISNDRELYYEYEDATLPIYCYNWVDIENEISNVASGKFPSGYKEKYRALKGKFHDFENVKCFCSKLYSDAYRL